VDRYDDSTALTAFYRRQIDKGNASYKTKFDALTLKVFPKGLNKVSVATFSGPPEFGMQLKETNDELQRNGLAMGQVIVALDGYALQNKKQYNFVWALFGLACNGFYYLGRSSLSRNKG